MRALRAIACAVLALGEPACSIAPAAGTGTAGTTTSTSTLGDQCAAVCDEYCSVVTGDCAVALSFSDCVTQEEALCCTGSTCDQLSTISDSTVTACKQTFDSEGTTNCYPLTQMTAASCLGL
ncbi:MAG TPA: hypothetical protein VH044_15885 [Polyangiaceae bacterium]|jgi:hypothetical protein|nr:hypothetical protein [Polyangiaceae bacterium]